MHLILNSPTFNFILDSLQNTFILNKPFYIYRSSAGSGKTRALAKAYLKLALRFGDDYFKYILVVTFTNKATQEMKERILQYLHDFSKGKSNSLSEELLDELQLTHTQLRQRSESLLSYILHEYSRFSVSTIDSFFQSVIYSFIQEAGLLGGFRLEIENKLVLREVLENLMEELGENKQLTTWMISFSRDQLMDGKNWNVLQALESFAGEIFKEHFKVVESQLENSSKDSNLHLNKMQILRQKVAVFEKHMKSKADQALAIIHKNHLTADDFKYKDKGTPLKYFLEFSKKKYFSSTGQRIQNALTSDLNWFTKKSNTVNVAQQLSIILKAMVDYDIDHATCYLSVCHVLKNFYAFGLIADIIRKLQAYRHENNLMLLSDTPRIIQKIIHDSDVPFIYEKIGTHFRHYMIDEFQDTSELQWENFYPLLKDSLDQGRSSFIVGDTKQSIYRWRGGNPHLLQQEVGHTVGENRIQIKNLIYNYRSADHIIKFNNILFKKATTIIDDITKQSFAKKAFGDVAQESGIQRINKGYTRIFFLEKTENETDWKEDVLRRLPILTEELQDKKVKLSDIAILVRKKEEGQRVAMAFLQYKNTKPKQGYCYDVVSDESLRIDTAPSVRFLLSALHYLHNPYNTIVCGQLAYHAKKEKPLDEIFQKASHLQMDEILPKEMTERIKELIKMPIYELTEALIRLLELGKVEGQRAYLQAFQNAVLEFATQKQSDLASFLEWWESVKDAKSLPATVSANAINILTIHKAKGLQFKYVIIPFLSWRLNHEKNPLLWVKSDHAPFNTMGYLAVSYSKELEKTYFSKDYLLERAKIYLDNLNLLYVSFTRAEEGLIVYAPKPKKTEKELTTVGELVHECIDKAENLKVNFKESEFSVGSIATQDEPSLINHSSLIPLKDYTTFDWRRKLTIKKEGTGLFQEDQQRDKIYYGILLHKVLARLYYKDDIDGVLQMLRLQEIITVVEQTKIADEIKKMFTHPTVSKWFDKKWDVHTEVPILMPTGKHKRIDRVMMYNKNTIVVDYKTGEETTQDRAQLKTYVKLLEQMGHTCTGYLLYLKSMKVIAL